jgi:hypothetical protein
VGFVVEDGGGGGGDFFFVIGLNIERYRRRVYMVLFGWFSF